MDTRPELNDQSADATARAVAAGLADELQKALETADADRYDSSFAADMLWGTRFGPLVVGHDRINAIHRRMMGLDAPVAPTSRFEVVAAISPALGVIVPRSAGRHSIPAHSPRSRCMSWSSARETGGCPRRRTPRSTNRNRF